METYKYDTDVWPIEIHSDFYEDDKENPNQYWINKKTNFIYKVKCRSKWCWFKLCYRYQVTLEKTQLTK